MSISTERNTLRPWAPSRTVALAAASLLAALIVAALLAISSPAQAQSLETLNQQISEARVEAQALAADVDAATAALAGARDRAAASSEREFELTALLAGGREREARLATQSAAAQRRLEAVRKRLGRAVDALSARLVAIYKSGEPSAFELLLGADGYDDLVSRGDVLRRIEDSDARLAARVRSLRADVRAKAETAQRARQAAALLNARLRSARQRVAGVRAQAESEARVAGSARDSQASSLASLRTNVQAWTRDVERLQQVSTENAQGEVISWFGGWAIPQAIVMCESGGNYSALNPSSGAGGAYQILPSTWAAYGGKGAPHRASKTEQDRIAALIWRDSGPSAWVCAG